VKTDLSNDVRDGYCIPLHASRCYIATALCWNTYFDLIEGSTLTELMDELSAVSERYGKYVDFGSRGKNRASEATRRNRPMSEQ
jgi:hypothetical protein